MDLTSYEVLVDLQTGAVSLVIPGADGDAAIEVETVTPDEEYAPRE